MAPISRAEQFLLVSGVLTSGLIIRATASCQIGSPLAETKDFSSSSIGVCFDGIGGDDTITGSAYDDVLTGGLGQDDILAGGGDDYVGGEGGADSVDGSDGNDTIVAGGGADPYLGGGNGADEISGGNMADGIDGGAAADLIECGAGNDSVVAEGGDDLVHGGAGADVLRTGFGNDEMYDNVDASPYAADTDGDIFCTSDGRNGDTVHIGTADSVDADGGDSIFVYDSLGNTPLFSGPFNDGSASPHYS